MSSTLNVSNDMSLLAKSDFFLLEYYFSMFRDITMDVDLGVNQRNKNINSSWAEAVYSKLLQTENGYEDLIDSMEKLIFHGDNFLYQTKLLGEYTQ